jgi:HK97 family phage major capsid protein
LTDNIIELASLRARRAELAGDFKSLMDKQTQEVGGEPVLYDTAKFDEIQTEIEAIDNKIGNTKTMDTTTKVMRGTPVGGAGGVVYATPKTDHKLTAFKSVDDAYRAGQWLTASFAKDPIVREQAFGWCQANGMGNAVVKYQAEGINTAGGFLVPQEFSTAIVDLREQYGTFRKNARVMQMSSDHMSIPRRSSGLTAYYTGENSAITESQKGWDSITLTAKKLACMTRLSTELAEDSAINVADDLAREMAYAFATAEDAAGWNGDGTSSYGGIQGVKTKFDAGVGSYVGAVDQTSGVDTFAEVTAPDIAKVMAALPRYARRNAKWYMSQGCWDGAFQRLMAALGGNTTVTLAGATNMSYLGYPVVIDQTLPGSGTVNNTPMYYFGDLSMACRMGSRRDIRVLVSDQRYMEYDQIAIQATERFDINVHDIGDASAAGPIVAGMGNS